MSNATPVPNALPVTDHQVFDGVGWFLTPVHNLSYDSYCALPRVVAFNGKSYTKMSFNTDTGTVAYKESRDVAFFAV